MIPQRNLSLLSNRLARKGGRRIPEAVLERDYCLSWFLVGLSETILRDILAFKGGTAIKKCYIPDYRFSEDLDFTLRNDVSFEHIQEQFDRAFKYAQQASGIRLNISRIDRHPHENSHSFFIGYEGPLPGATGKEVKVDITIRERLVFPIEGRPILKTYAEYADLPAEATIGVYTLHEIAAEKIVAIFDPARNEPRDLYDLWFLVSHDFLKLGELIDAVGQKMHSRGKDLANTHEIFIRKEARLKKLWESRLSSQMAELPKFDQVHRRVVREFRQAGFLGDIHK
ncbi:MAG: nucleotidyl transferase AbiEii/AbiGii toxin family protein [Deltaproteobacteria bacterium]|nr:nucleotidyl transferase AbiEii/AbiGii toxin family protein [Deltaproteobacteria bacterium]